METSPTKLGFINVHKLIGSTILFLVLARLIWRFYNTKPSNSNLSIFHRTVSGIIHMLLYILIIFIPLIGMFYIWFSGYNVSILGIFNLPPLVDKDVAFAKQILPIHYNLTLLLIGLFILHLFAAIYHRFIIHDKYGIWKRMSFNFKKN